MSLKIIISQLYQQAHDLPTRTASQTLEKGLKLEVWCEASEIYLQLSRPDVYPSRAEWKTTVERWPVAATSEPARRVVANRYCLVSVVTPITPLFELPAQHSDESQPYA